MSFCCRWNDDRLVSSALALQRFNAQQGIFHCALAAIAAEQVLWVCIAIEIRLRNVRVSNHRTRLSYSIECHYFLCSLVNGWCLWGVFLEDWNTFLILYKLSVFVILIKWRRWHALLPYTSFLIRLHQKKHIQINCLSLNYSYFCLQYFCVSFCFSLCVYLFASPFLSIDF